MDRNVGTWHRKRYPSSLLVFKKSLSEVLVPSNLEKTGLDDGLEKVSPQ